MAKWILIVASANEISANTDDDLRPEYDLAVLLKVGVRGKYVKRYQAETNLVLLGPESVKASRTPEAANNGMQRVAILSIIDDSEVADEKSTFIASKG